MSDKQCNMDRVLLEEYADDMLNQVEKILVEQHIKSCSCCRKQLTEMKLLFWEIGNLAKHPIDYPDDLKELGIKLISASPAKASVVRDTIGNMLTSQKRAWSGISGFLKSIPLPGKTRIRETAITNHSSTAFASKLSGRIKLAGRNMIKRQLAHLVGGVK